MSVIHVNKTSVQWDEHTAEWSLALNVDSGIGISSLMSKSPGIIFSFEELEVEISHELSSSLFIAIV